MRQAKHSPIAFLATILALLCQLLAAPPGSASASGVAFTIHVCGIVPEGGAPHAPMPGHKDCDHCPLCLGLATQPALHTNFHAVPAGTAVFHAVLWRIVPGSVAHQPGVAAAEPRGPPALT